jgi:hypothetical protein
LLTETITTELFSPRGITRRERWLFPFHFVGIAQYQ